MGLAMPAAMRSRQCDQGNTIRAAPRGHGNAWACLQTWPPCRPTARCLPLLPLLPLPAGAQDWAVHSGTDAQPGAAAEQAAGAGHGVRDAAGEDGAAGGEGRVRMRMPMPAPACKLRRCINWWLRATSWLALPPPVSHLAACPAARWCELLVHPATVAPPPLRCLQDAKEIGDEFLALEK